MGIFFGVLPLWGCGGDGGGSGQGAAGVPSAYRVYFSDTGIPGIVVIDPETNAPTDDSPISLSGGIPGALAPSPDGSILYAMAGSNFNSTSSLSVIDALFNFEINFLDGAGDLFNQIVVSPNGKRLYLLYRRSSGTATLEIKVFDLSTDPTFPELITTISNNIFDGCFGPLGLGIRPDGKKLYLACRPTNINLQDRFYMVDTDTNTPTQTATFTRDETNNASINAIAVKKNGSQVYLARADIITPAVEVFNGATGAHVKSIALPENALPRAGVVSPNSKTLYVVDQGLGTHVVDATTNTYLMTMSPTQSRGFDIAISPDGTHLYTTLLDNVFVLDATTNTPATTIPGDFLFTAANQIVTIPFQP